MKNEDLLKISTVIEDIQYHANSVANKITQPIKVIKDPAVSLINKIREKATQLMPTTKPDVGASWKNVSRG